MAITDAYAGVEEYRGAAGNTDDAETVALARHLKLMSRALERRVGMYFNQETVARRWQGDGGQCLRIRGGRSLCPGLASLTDLVVKLDTARDGLFASTVALTDFDLRPLDAPFGPEPGPYTELFLHGRSSVTYTSWPEYYEVQITGTWGWPSIPALIKDATIELTRIWRIEGPRATGRMLDADNLFSTSRDAQNIIDQLLQTYHPTGGIAIG